MGHLFSALAKAVPFVAPEGQHLNKDNIQIIATVPVPLIFFSPLSVALPAGGSKLLHDSFGTHACKLNLYLPYYVGVLPVFQGV